MGKRGFGLVRNRLIGDGPLLHAKGNQKACKVRIPYPKLLILRGYSVFEGPVSKIEAHRGGAVRFVEAADENSE
jgi:hypothetical protein